MLWLLYNILFAIGFTLMLPRAFVRMFRRGGYARHFSQRFALYGRDVLERLDESRRIWVHAVSVGEVFVALRFIEEFRARRPAARFVVTTTTSTGHAMAEKGISPEDVLIYFPLDFPFIVRRALRLIRPKALVLVECELWPNLIRLAKRSGIPVALINGRISEHSYRGYRKLRAFTRPLLACADLLCVQGEGDRDRLVHLGADPARIRVVGSAKYDLLPLEQGPEATARAAIAAAGAGEGRLVLLGGSTWAGEEAVLLDIYRELRARFPKLFLVLVPRHAERSAAVLREIEDRGLKAVRKTALNGGTAPGGARAEVLLVDTTGELRGFYACADIIFVGKSLTEHGGQNIIEPAQSGRAILVGPNMENFASVVPDFLAAGALLQVQDAAGLKVAIERLAAEPARAADLGSRAAQLVKEKAGAVGRTLDLVSSLPL